MAAVLRAIPGQRAKVGIATESSAPLTDGLESSDAEPTAPPPTTFESERPAAKPTPEKPSTGGAVAAKMKAQPVSSGGPDMEKILRQGFVRKVYGILAAQIVLTFGLIGVFQTHDVNIMMKQCYEIKCVKSDGTAEKVDVDCLIKGCDETGGQCFNPEVTALSDDMKPALDYQVDPNLCPGGMLRGGSGIGGDGEGKFYMTQPTDLMLTLYYAGLFVALAALIMLTCCIQSLGRRYPHNYILLAVFTAAEGFNLGTYCVFSDANVILVAAGMTAAITLGLSIFACQTKIDFTGMGGYLFAALWALILFGIVVNMGWAPGGARNVYLLIGVLIFSMFIVYDTQTIVGGEHKSYQFDMDDYVLAALVIYLDIINLFILLLQLLNGGRRD